VTTIIDPRRLYWGSKSAWTGLSSTHPTKRRTPGARFPTLFRSCYRREAWCRLYPRCYPPDMAKPTEIFDKSWSLSQKSKFFYDVYQEFRGNSGFWLITLLSKGMMESLFHPFHSTGEFCELCDLTNWNYTSERPIQAKKRCGNIWHLYRFYQNQHIINSLLRQKFLFLISKVFLSNSFWNLWKNPILLPTSQTFWIRRISRKNEFRNNLNFEISLEFWYNPTLSASLGSIEKTNTSK
jgi:hypothetical protein